MKRIDRYLLARISVAVMTALAVLVLLFSFFELMGELGALKNEGYTLSRAVVGVVLDIPTHIRELLPIAALLGALFAFARLAQDSEFTVMRASGLTPGRSVRVLLILGAVLALLNFALGDFVLPHSEAYAQHIRGGQRGKITQQFRSGLWARDGSAFINVRNVLPDGSLGGIRIYEVAPDYRLQGVIQAAQGRWMGSGLWRLENVRTTTLDDSGTRNTESMNLDWHSKVDPDLLAMLMISPQQMTVIGLFEYIHYLKANRQKTERYQLALWNKLTFPLAIPVLLLLALPFAYLNVRSRGVGASLMLGIGLGLVFYFSNRISGNIGLLQNWPPMLSAWLVLILFAIIALYGLWRAERV